VVVPAIVVVPAVVVVIVVVPVPVVVPVVVAPVVVVVPAVVVVVAPAVVPAVVVVPVVVVVAMFRAAPVAVVVVPAVVRFVVVLAHGRILAGRRRPGSQRGPSVRPPGRPVPGPRCATLGAAGRDPADGGTAMVRYGPLVALAAVLGLTGCSSGTSGRGTDAASRTPLVTVDPESASPTATATALMTRGGGGGGSTGRPTRTSSPTPRQSPTTDPNAMAEIVSYRATAGPGCTGSSGSSTVSLSWQTRGGTEVWIQVTPVAVGAGDPRTTPGAYGPLPTNGTRTLPFDCRNAYDYYNLGVYNTGNGTHSGVILQVPRNV